MDKIAASKGVVSADTLKARGKCNIINLSGQGLICIIKIFLSNFALIVINRKDIFGLDRSAYVILVAFASAIISVTLLASSPELKRHYLHSKSN